MKGNSEQNIIKQEAKSIDKLSGTQFSLCLFVLMGICPYPFARYILVKYLLRWNCEVRNSFSWCGLCIKPSDFIQFSEVNTEAGETIFLAHYHDMGGEMGIVPNQRHIAITFSTSSLHYSLM